MYLAPCKSDQNITAACSLPNSGMANSAYMHGTNGISIYSNRMKVLRWIGTLFVPNDLMLSKMLTFAPGKLFASYCTSFIHSSASGVCPAPSNIFEGACSPFRLQSQPSGRGAFRLCCESFAQPLADSALVLQTDPGRSRRSRGTLDRTPRTRVVSGTRAKTAGPP